MAAHNFPGQDAYAQPLWRQPGIPHPMQAQLVDHARMQSGGVQSGAKDPEPYPPIVSAMSEQESRIDQLGFAVGRLEERLNSVLKPTSGCGDDSLKAAVEPVRSPHLGLLTRHNERLCAIEAHLNDLWDRLEV